MKIFKNIYCHKRTQSSHSFLVCRRANSWAAIVLDIQHWQFIYIFLKVWIKKHIRKHIEKIVEPETKRESMREGKRKQISMFDGNYFFSFGFLSKAMTSKLKTIIDSLLTEWITKTMKNIKTKMSQNTWMRQKCMQSWN